jgi:hypothetical protein
MDEAPVPRFKIRLFCDICDVFDEHDTDDCPTQASEAPDVGSMNHGSRTESRPYCTTCEGKVIMMKLVINGVEVMVMVVLMLVIV